MAGQLCAGRKVSSSLESNTQVSDTIDFIYEQLWKDKDFLHQKYVLEGRSIAQISGEILSSRAAVRDALIEFGIARKPQGKPGLRPAQVPYGYRMSNGLMVPHLGETLLKRLLPIALVEILKQKALPGQVWRQSL